MLYKFNSVVRICIVLFLIVPIPAFADHVPTQTPYGISIACDSDGDTTKGDVTVTWQESDGFESSPPERYAIAFSNDNFVETNYAVANSTGWETALSYKSYAFTASYRETIFGTTADTFYAKVRADNDTDASYSEWTGIVSVDCDYGSTPTTTTSSTTTSSTTTTTTTTTVPPKPEPEPEPYIPPPPPPTPQEIIVDVKVEGVDKTYTQADVNDGTIERDQERVDNEAEFGCFMTNAQIERGDCDIPKPIEEDIKDDIIKEEVIVEEIKEDVEVIIPKDDVDVLDPPKEEVFEDEVVEFEELPIEFEIIEFDLEDIAPEIVVEIPIQDEELEEIIDEEVKEDVKEVLDEPIQEVVSEDTPGTTLPRVEDKEPIELTEEEVEVEIAQIEEIVNLPITEETDEESKQEAIQEFVQDLTEEEVVEVLEEVNDIGVQNLDQATEEIQEVVQAVVEEAIADVQELTEEQVEVVAEVLQVEAADVEIIAAAVVKDEAISEAVEEYVERAVENSDVENYSLADVVTEVQTEQFLADPIGSFVDIQIDQIDLAEIGSDMTSDQKEKAQEVVVPVIIASQIIASMQVVPVRIRRS
mgnify:FL=1